MNNHISLSYKALSLGLTIVFLVALLGASAGTMLLAPQLNGVAQAAQTTGSDADIVAAYERALSSLYETTVPSVVSIRVTQKLEANSNFPFDFGQPESPNNEPGQPDPREFFNRGQGSGFVWDQEGHIITNNHVVEGASSVEVIFADGQTFEAQVLGADPNSDLAVIKVDRPAADLKAVTLGDSDQLKVGQLAIAIGNPFGQEFTMTSGIISAIGRTIRSGNAGFSIPEAVQTDTSINPGNSGGPLLDRTGAVIGINSQIFTRSGANEGIGFAVPINTAKRVIPTLIKGEEYKYAWLGISGASVGPELIDLMKLPSDTSGALVIEVVKDGPADKAGLAGSDKTQTVDGLDYQVGGDVITAINGQAVASIEDVITYLAQSTRPGDKAALEVIHADGTRATIEVILGERPSVPQPAEE
jgi:S1-C subfamily serine protease